MRHIRSTSCHALRVLFALILLVLEGGCSTIGDVIPALRIDESEQPRYHDEQVRFRTTYYFRIVDSCKVGEDHEVPEFSSHYTSEEQIGPFRVRQSGKFKIVNDSLYRFRMTGKASALFAKIRFESGVLRAEEIDHLGSTVAPDKDTGTFHVTSASTNRRNARRDEIEKEIARLKDLLGKAKNGELGKGTKNADNPQFILEKMIVNQIKLLARENDSGESVPQLNNEELLCEDGRPTQKSYSLYGPEGVRRLDPDERLLMAMTSDSKPLIGMLQELTARSLKTQQIHGNGFEDIVAERARVSHAQRDIETLVKKDKLTQSDIADLMKSLETRFGSKL